MYLFLIFFIFLHIFCIVHVLYIFLCQEIAKDEFEVDLCVEEAGFVVRRLKEPTTRCVVSLTSPIIREEIMTGTSVILLLKAVFKNKSYHLAFKLVFEQLLCGQVFSAKDLPKCAKPYF